MSQDATSLNRAHRLLQNLLQSRDGLPLYEKLNRAYRLCAQQSAGVERFYLSVLDQELTKFIGDPESEPGVRMIAKFIQRKLAPITHMAPVDQGKSKKGARGKTFYGDMPDDPDKMEAWLSAQLKQQVEAELDDETFRNSNASGLARVNLGRQQQKLSVLQKRLRRHLDYMSETNRDFLHDLKEARVRLADSEQGEEVARLKQLLTGTVDAMTGWQDHLTDTLSDMRKDIRSVHSENLRLNDEIVRVRQMSLIDEFTGLPNRIAFMRQLQAEMGRARRNQYPLIVCVMAVDGMDNMASTLGEDVADRVLCSYAEDVISQFRSYDTVARVGAQEFAILLPDTSVDGAIQALAEAQHRAAQHHYHHGDKQLILPSFSVGLAHCRPKEHPASVMERAERALQQAINEGEKGIEVAGKLDSKRQKSKPVVRPQPLH